MPKFIKLKSMENNDEAYLMARLQHLSKRKRIEADGREG